MDLSPERKLPWLGLLVVEDADLNQIKHARQQCSIRQLHWIPGWKKQNGERELFNEAAVLQYRLQELQNLHEC